MKTKYLKYASLISWCIGVIFMVVALFTMNKWISIPMVLSLISGSVLNYVYVKKTSKDVNNEDSQSNT